MKISGAISVLGPSIPARLVPHIDQRTCCRLTADEIAAFSAVLRCLDQYIQRHPFPAGARCIVIYTDQPQVTLLPDHELGQSLPLVLIWLAPIRQRSDYSQALLMLVFAEELCHALYLISDEHLVKETLFAVLAPCISTLTLHDAYPTLFDMDDHRIL